MESQMDTKFSAIEMDFEEDLGDFIYRTLKPVRKSPQMVSILDINPDFDQGKQDPSPRSKVLDSLPDLDQEPAPSKTPV